MTEKIKRIHFFIAAALLCFFAASSAAYGQAAENISILKRFQFDIGESSVNENSLKTDGIFIDFFLTRASSGKIFQVKIQTDSGRVESFDQVSGITLSPPASSEETYLKCGGAETFRAGSFACDGPVIAAAEFKLNKKLFYSAIASDNGLYIFPGPVKNGVRTAPVFKTHLTEEPRKIYVSNDLIFVLTAKFLSCFQVKTGALMPAGRLAVTSETAYTQAQTLKKNIKLITESNNFGFDARYLSSDFFRFHKLAAVRSDSSENLVLAYFTGSFGSGNRNIYSINSDLGITKISNFSGIITGFDLIDPKKPSLLIKHRKFDAAEGTPAASWIFTPPQNLANPAGTPFEDLAPDPGTRLVASSEKTGANERLGVFIDGSSENGILKLKKMTAAKDVLHEISSFQLPAAVRDIDSPDFVSAISHNAKSPVFAYYAPRSSRVWIIDAAGGHIIDGVYFNQRYGRVTSMKFLDGGDILAIKTDLFEGSGLSGIGSSSLFIYRLDHKLLTEICRHKIITDYDYIRYNNGNHIIMTFGKKRTEPDSIGIINIR